MPAASCQIQVPGQWALWVHHTWGLGGLRKSGSLVSCPMGPCLGLYLEILDVFGAAELRQACRPHQGKEVEEKEPMAPQDGVGPLTVAPEPAGRGRGGGFGSFRPLPPQLPLTHPQHYPSRDKLTPPGAPSTTGGLRHSHLSNFSLLFVFPCWITWTKS